MFIIHILGIYDFGDELWETVSESAKDVVRKLMCVDATKRASLSEVLEHEWLTGEPDLMDRLQALVRRDYQDGLEEKLIKCLKIGSSGAAASAGEAVEALEVETEEEGAEGTRRVGRLKRLWSTGSEASQKTEAAEASGPSRQSPRNARKQRRVL